MHLQRKHKTKTGNVRKIPLHDEVKEIIKSQVGKHNDYVFVNKKGERVGDHATLKILKKTLKILGIPGNQHKLRPQFC